MNAIDGVTRAIIDFGCHQHALCIGDGVKVIPLSVNDLLINIFYHFDLSEVKGRIVRILGVYGNCYTENHEVLRHPLVVTAASCRMHAGAMACSTQLLCKSPRPRQARQGHECGRTAREPRDKAVLLLLGLHLSSSQQVQHLVPE